MKLIQDGGNVPIHRASGDLNLSTRTHPTAISDKMKWNGKMSPVLMVGKTRKRHVKLLAEDASAFACSLLNGSKISTCREKHDTRLTWAPDHYSARCGVICWMWNCSVLREWRGFAWLWNILRGGASYRLMLFSINTYTKSVHPKHQNKAVSHTGILEASIVSPRMSQSWLCSDRSQRCRCGAVLRYTVWSMTGADLITLLPCVGGRVDTKGFPISCRTSQNGKQRKMRMCHVCDFVSTKDGHKCNLIQYRLFPCHWYCLHVCWFQVRTPYEVRQCMCIYMCISHKN